ncbi:hypothetical protein [Rothia dentocariosa]|uniref:hypothetical protein n=1 Tax=Rothia dentocariosa TaxID=2047 RepID=UPI00241D64CA|nr:hypothetical protein [Rothia dentocariosa]
MGYYDDGYGNSFFPAIYITEDNVLKRQTQALRDQGWAVIEISCAAIVRDGDAGVKEILRAIEFPYDIPTVGDPVGWTEEFIEDLHWLDLSKGVFVVLKDYDALFSVHDAPEYYNAKRMARHLQTVDSNLRHRHTRFAYADYDPPNVLYAIEVSRNKLDTVLEFFEGHATIIESFDEDNPGAEYPPFKKYVDETRRNRLYGISTW